MYKILATAAVVSAIATTSICLNSAQSSRFRAPSTEKVQTIEGPKGLSLPFESTVSSEAREPLRSVTPEGLQLRFRTVGSTTVSGVDLVIGSPDQHTNEPTYLINESLILKHGACIVTNGNPLVIFTNNIVSEDGCIVAFKPGQHKAGNGEPGKAGKSGFGGGLVSIHVVHGISGILHTDLTGQVGGDGGPSNVAGAAGPNGAKGDQSVSGVFGCMKGGGNGSAGSPGGVGGTGNDGGNGGPGGTLELFNVGDRPLPSASYTFIAQPAQGGAGGAGGPGGPGGQGGPGGDGSGFCNGGSPGPNGAPGPTGPQGHQGASGNSSGTLIVKNLDLQFFSKEEPLRLSQRLRQ